MPDLSFEDAAGGIVCGVDEAGRGPWAGPVVAGAVILDRAALGPGDLLGLDDSKKLPKGRRQALFAELTARHTTGVGIASVAEVDALNILQAALLAMARAVGSLGRMPGLALVDGNRAPALAIPVQCVIGGDGKSLSIAAASVVAKVTRDRIMAGLALRHAGYGWERNAGYGTAEHKAALWERGPTPEHRYSFRPVRDAAGR